MTVAGFTNLPKTLQKVWLVKFAFDSNCCDCSKQRNRCDEIIDLSERSIHSIDVGPLRRARIESRLELRRRRPTRQLMWQIDSSFFIEFEFIDHGHDSREAHLQSQAIKIAVTRLHDRRMQVRLAVISHATSKLVSDLNAATARQA